MTIERQQQIMGEILKQIALWADPAHEAIIHASINKRIKPVPTSEEFLQVLKSAHLSGYITGKENPIKGTRWSLTDKGAMLLDS